MIQPPLPLLNPQDRGRLNALRNIVAAISEELRTQAPVAEGIVNFNVNELPAILKSNSPFDILPADYGKPSVASPYRFEILDLVNSPRQLDVYPTIADLVRQLDIPTLSSRLGNAELIGIDESQVDTPLPHSTLSFLKSIAFRMFQQADGVRDEAVGPILSKMRMPLREKEVSESENKLISYVRNTFLAYVSALTAVAFGRRPFIVLHGPLVRAIGPFSSISFDYDTARDLFDIDFAEAGEVDIPASTTAPVLQGDTPTARNLPLAFGEATNGEKNLRKFNEYCLFSCGRKCYNSRIIPERAVPPAQQSVTKDMMKSREYPGFCLYFWALRSLFDLARLANITVSAVVEDVSASTEMTRLVLPSLIALPTARQAVERSGLKAALQKIGVSFLTSPQQRRDLYRQVKTVIERLSLSDSNLFSYALAEGQFTSPVQIHRYRSQRDVEGVMGSKWAGIDNELEDILDTLFPAQGAQGGYPGYRVLMSYLRTSPLREPVRVEYFDVPNLNYRDDVVGPIYLLSLPYQEYGLPVILYYADKLARTPTSLVRTIVEREYLELVLNNRFNDDPISVRRILGHLNRGYFQREGLQ